MSAKVDPGRAIAALETMNRIGLTYGQIAKRTGVPYSEINFMRRHKFRDIDADVERRIVAALKAYVAQVNEACRIIVNW